MIARSALRLAPALLAALLAAGCAQNAWIGAAWPSDTVPAAQLTGLRSFDSPALLGAPAALAAALATTGAAVDDDALAAAMAGDARGLQRDLLALPRRHARISFRLAPRLPDVLREVGAGTPVIVLQDVGNLATQWQYALVTGYDIGARTVTVAAGGTRETMSFGSFERSWAPGGSWAMVVLPPDRVAASASEERWLAAIAALDAGGDLEAAVEASAAALQRWPDSLPAAIGLAHRLHARGELREAVDVLRGLQVRNPQSVIVLNNLAQTLSDLGRHTEALAILDQARDTHSPFAADIRATRHRIEQRLQQPQRAGR